MLPRDTSYFPPVWRSCLRRGMPADTSVRVSASYATEGGDVRVAAASFDLPLALAAAVIAPVRASAFKFTLDTNRPPVALPDLFADMLAQVRRWEGRVAAPPPPPPACPPARLQPACVLPPETLSRASASAGSVLSFGYYCGGDASILASKAGGRYRVQVCVGGRGYEGRRVGLTPPCCPCLLLLPGRLPRGSLPRVGVAGTAAHGVLLRRRQRRGRQGP